MIVKKINTKIGKFYYGIIRENNNFGFSLLDSKGEFIANVTPTQIEKVEKITHISQLVDFGIFRTLQWANDDNELKENLQDIYEENFEDLDIINHINNISFVGDVLQY